MIGSVKCIHFIKEFNFETLMAKTCFSQDKYCGFFPAGEHSLRKLIIAITSCPLASKEPSPLFHPGPNIVILLPSKACSTAAAHMKCFKETTQGLEVARSGIEAVIRRRQGDHDGWAWGPHTGSGQLQKETSDQDLMP